MKLKQDFLVGLIFLIGMVIIGIFTIVVKDITILSGSRGKMSIVFDRVDGLEPGHKVLASGMEVGVVSDLELREDGKVRVTVTLTEPIKLYRGYRIEVKDASALGGKYINIDVRPQKENVIFRLEKNWQQDLQEQKLTPKLKEEFAKNRIELSEQANVTLAANQEDWLIQDPKSNKKYRVQRFAQSLAVVPHEEVEKPLLAVSSQGQTPATLEKVPPLEGKAKPSIFDDPNISELIDSLKKIAKTIERGEGTIGLLIKEREIYDNLMQTSSNLKEVTEQLRNPNTTIGKLLYDDKLYQQIEVIAGNAEEISTKINRGDGLVGRLINDQALADSFQNTVERAEQMMQNINDITSDVKQGKGTIGKLFTDDQVYQNLEVALEDARSMIQGINEVVAEVNAGKGTIGALVKDQQMADDLKQTLASLQTVASRLEKGEGTIGKLMKDDLLYQEIHRLVKSFSDSIEDTREQVPITTFTGMLFKAF